MLLSALSPVAMAAGHVATSVGPSWMDPQHLIQQFGGAAIIGIAIVIFIETGLLFPFLPGDSLLFTAGALVAQGTLVAPGGKHIDLVVLCLILFAAAFLGDQTAFFIGHFVGGKLFDRPDSKIFKRKYIDKTMEYFDKYGGRTIVIARFVPIIRTYAAASAGIGRMRWSHFVGFNALGGAMWVGLVTSLGYALGNITFVRNNIEALIVVIVLVSVLPMFVEVWRARRANKKAAVMAAGAARHAAAPEE